MASRGKKKTTMAKLTREARLRERRVEKQARKEARRESGASAEPDESLYPVVVEHDGTTRDHEDDA